MPSNGSLCLAKTLTRDLRNGHLESSLTGYYARSFGCKKAPSAADSWSQDAMCMTSKHWKECYSSSVCHPRKKELGIKQVNERLLQRCDPEQVDIIVRKVEQAEMDEMWSFVGIKIQQRFLWHAI